MLRTTSIAAIAAAAAVFTASPTASATGTTELHAVTVAGGKPPGVVEGQHWGTYAMLRDAAGRRIGEVTIGCRVDKAKDPRVLASCTHTLRIPGKGSLVLQGVHHYLNQNIMPGTAAPMLLVILDGTGDFAQASGAVNVVEVVGGYTYTFEPMG